MIKNFFTYAGVVLGCLLWVALALASAALPVVLIWYLVTH